MLSKLKWDLSAITPHDFLEQILSRLPVDQLRALTIKRHAQTFIAICSTGEVHYILAAHFCFLYITFLPVWLGICQPPTKNLK